MAIKTDLDWFGEDEKKDMSDAMVRFLIRGTDLVQADAKLIITSNKRVDTGNLRASIVKAVDKSNLIGTVFTNSEYAVYNEFGTGRFAEGGTGRSTPWAYQNAKGQWRWTTGMTAQPFMRPALNNNKEKLLKIAISEGEKSVS